jgi:predicted nucleic acid-binding protein
MNKIIISDTSCLIALSNIGLLSVLKDLYHEVLITAEVEEEFGNQLPNWIIVLNVKDKQKQIEIERKLDKGEASSIALALEIPNSVLIIDEVKGRNIAKSLNIEIIGTIGILLLAGNKGLLKDVISVILKLVNNGFRLSNKIVDRLIEKYGRK